MSGILDIPFDPVGLDPKVTHVLDDIVTAIQTWANKGIIDAGSYGSFVQPRCRYYLAADQVLTNNTDTSLLWTGPAQPTDSVATATQYDNGALFGPSAFVPAASMEYLTPPIPGQYLVIAGCNFGASAVGRRDLWLQQRLADGAYFDIAAMNMPTNIAGGVTNLQVSAVVTMNGGSVRVRVFQNSGGNLNASAGFSGTYVQMIKLS